MTRKPPVDPAAAEGPAVEPTLPSMGAVKSPSSSGEHEAVRRMQEEFQRGDELVEQIRRAASSSAPPTDREPTTPREPVDADVPRDEHVMVVDDEHELADLLAAELREEGYQVRVAYDGLDALIKLLREPATDPDCIILDIGLPYLSGPGVAAALDHTHLRDVPKIWISAGDERGIRPEQRRDFIFLRKGSKVSSEARRLIGANIAEWRQRRKRRPPGVW